MRSKPLAALILAAQVTSATPIELESRGTHSFIPRNIVDEIADEYDFVVVGGGLSGLVLGGRLSEDSNHTVLVLESGGNGDAFRERIDTPSYAYFESLWPTELNWNFNTTPQAGANNNRLPWPRGKVLGGSSAINGLYMNRPGEIEINAWRDMLGDMDGADNWSWDSFYAAMKKSEIFTPAIETVAQEGGIVSNSASFGSNGPIHLSYPGYTFPLNKEWLVTTQNAGIENSPDTYDGRNWGSYVSTSCINPTNWTRSYSRTGYLDVLPPRPNYDVLANAHVTRLLFNSSSPKNSLRANQVEYSRSGDAARKTVRVRKEVILTGGSVGTPAILLYSGVGPKDVLERAGVAVVSELPGVGQHLQDHLSVSAKFTTDKDTAGSLYEAKGPESADPKFLSYINSAVAYINGSLLFGDQADTLQSEALGIMKQYNPKPGDADVSAGYEAIYETTANKIVPSPLGLVEFLIGNDLDGVVNIGAALQHPFSHGSITINSANPLDYPTIDPNYLAHPTDLKILREGIKLIRRLGQTEPLKSSLTGESWPGPDIQTDAEWEEWLRDNVFTEFHPSSSCAMLPQEQGGVVDANLRVYGLSNVRVADASVPPISFSAHLMVSTYGIAEQASTIIRNHHNRQTTRNSSASTNSTSSATGSTSTSNGTSTGDSDDALGTADAKNNSNQNAGLELRPFSFLMAIAVIIATLCAL